MAERVGHDFGGIRSLAAELKAHGGAINYDLITKANGLTRADIGRRLSWADFRDFLTWQPPTAESAWYRARKPNSWWVTPQLQILAGILYAAEGANWQRGGGSGNQPKPINFPEDKPDPKIRSAHELSERRQRLRQRRESRG